MALIGDSQPKLFGNVQRAARDRGSSFSSGRAATLTIVRDRGHLLTSGPPMSQYIDSSLNFPGAAIPCRGFLLQNLSAAGPKPNNCSLRSEGPGSQLGLLPRQLSASVKKPNNCSIAAGEEGQPKLPHRHFRFAVEIHSGEFVTHRFTFCSFEVN